VLALRIAPFQVGICERFQINSGAINISLERSPKFLRYFYYEQSIEATSR